MKIFSITTRVILILLVAFLFLDKYILDEEISEDNYVSDSTEYSTTIPAIDEWWDIESSKSSPDTKSTATLYTSIKPLEEGELPMQIMRFTTPTEDWLRTIDEWSNIKKYEFIDNEHLLIVTQSIMVESTGILNMGTQHLEWVGGGVGEIITWNENKKLIKLYGNKSYRWDENMEPMGAMWYDLIVNETGDIIQLLTPDYWELVSSNGERRIDYSTLSEECIPIKDILRSYDPEYYANIEQPLDDCIRVNR